MKATTRITPALLATALLLTLGGCKMSRAERREFRTDESRPVRYEHVMVTAMNHGPDRIVVEETLAGWLRAEGYRVTPSYTAFGNLKTTSWSEVNAYVSGHDIGGVLTVIAVEPPLDADGEQSDESREPLIEKRTRFRHVLDEQAETPAVLDTFWLEAALFHSDFGGPGTWRPIWSEQSGTFSGVAPAGEGAAEFVAASIEANQMVSRAPRGYVWPGPSTPALRRAMR